jgi:cyclopropane fatty-acyl-phospholipid synthase-like methyltransferase
MISALTNPHYEKIASRYHTHWFYAQDTAYEKWMLTHLLTQFNLSKYHTVCDLGSGSGRYAELMTRAIEFIHPVTCVDASHELLHQGQTRLDRVHMDMQSYVRFVQTADKWFDRILIKEAIHHVSVGELSAFFKDIYSILSVRGQLLIVTRPQTVDFPIPLRAKDLWAETQLDPSTYANILSQSGFEVDITYTDFLVEMSRTEWTLMIRNRMWSIFSEQHFSSDELETELEQLDLPNTVTFVDRIVWIRGTKL